MKNPTPPVDGKYGAPMGRPVQDRRRPNVEHHINLRGHPHNLSFGERVAEVVEDTGPFYLRRVPLNSGGYDAGGAYWGIGAPLYYYEGPSGVSGYVRGRTRDDAKREVRGICPRATFHGEKRKRK